MGKKIFLKTILAVVIVSLSVCAGVISFKYSKEKMLNMAFANSLSASIENSETLEKTEKQREQECFSNSGNWNMATVCTDSGFEEVSCEISGEISAFGLTFKGSYTKGENYSVAWARYECQDSKGNCCIKQGLYSGDDKLA